ncbi:hypothetical protein D3C73_1174560 [compost metagenome]
MQADDDIRGLSAGGLLVEVALEAFGSAKADVAGLDIRILVLESSQDRFHGRLVRLAVNQKRAFLAGGVQDCRVHCRCRRNVRLNGVGVGGVIPGAAACESCEAAECSNSDCCTSFHVGLLCHGTELWVGTVLWVVEWMGNSWKGRRKRPGNPVHRGVSFLRCFSGSTSHHGVP